MADLTTVTDFPPWSINYDYKQSHAVTRSQERGYKRQAKYSHRSVRIAQVTRKLSGIELPFFEHFVLSVIADGSQEFEDKYKDETGVQTGTMRIVDGVYSVNFNAPFSYEVNCTIEILE